MAATSFVKRRIDIAIKLVNSGTNQPSKFQESGTDQVTLRGLRASIRIQYAGGLHAQASQIAIFGLTPSLMNQLATLGMVLNQINKNQITITAGDEGGQMSVVFIGHILQAYADYGSQPEVPFRFESLTGAAETVIAVPALSYNGATQVSTIFNAIASRAGWGFENSGVDSVIKNPYLDGSPMSQIEKLRRAARCEAQVLNNVLCIWPRFGSRRAEGSIPLISKDTGMIGYPSFTQDGIVLKSIFRPEIRFMQKVKIESDVFSQDVLKKVGNVNGEWVPYRMDLALDSETPNGLWQEDMWCYKEGGIAPLIQK